MTRIVLDYFRKALVIREDEFWVPRFASIVARWFFDVLKNMLTVGALFAIASKTGSPTLQGLAVVSSGMLGLFIIAPPMQKWSLNSLHPVKNQSARLAGMVVARLIIGGAIVGITYFEIRPAVEAVTDWNWNSK